MGPVEHGALGRPWRTASGPPLNSIQQQGSGMHRSKNRRPQLRETQVIQPIMEHET